MVVSLVSPGIGSPERNESKSLHCYNLSRGELMANLKGLVSVVSQLRVERTNLVNQLRHVDAALSVLGRLNGQSEAKPRRTISASGRKRIAAAQKARWAKVRGQKVVLTRKRTMSASARRKIAETQRARWAKLKAGKKAA